MDSRALFDISTNWLLSDTAKEWKHITWCICYKRQITFYFWLVVHTWHLWDTSLNNPDIILLPYNW